MCTCMGFGDASVWGLVGEVSVYMYDFSGRGCGDLWGLGTIVYMYGFGERGCVHVSVLGRDCVNVWGFGDVSVYMHGFWGRECVHVWVWGM